MTQSTINEIYYENESKIMLHAYHLCYISFYYHFLIF